MTLEKIREFAICEGYRDVEKISKWKGYDM